MRDRLEDSGVLDLLKQHLIDMYQHSPADSVFALKPEQLSDPNTKFLSARINGKAVGCIALKYIGNKQGEIKSMRVASSARKLGIGQQLLQELLTVAQREQLDSVLLETGSADFFKPAIKLYEKFGFIRCRAFGEYEENPFSVFMELKLSPTLDQKLYD